MKNILIIFGFLITISNSYGQCQLSQRQIKKRNYQEAIPAILDSIRIKPDKMPMYPNGKEGVRQHASKYTKYPKKAVKSNIQGRVIISFVVNKKGMVDRIKVIQSVDPLLDNEAIRVIKLLELFVPAYKDGKPVSVGYIFPIDFKL